MAAIAIDFYKLGQHLNVAGQFVFSSDFTQFEALPKSVSVLLILEDNVRLGDLPTAVLSC